MSKLPESMNDFLTGTPERIIGTETETVVNATYLPDLERVHALDSLRIPAGSRGLDEWLRTGGRLYYELQDADNDDDWTSEYTPGKSVLEYATPECLGAEQAAVHEVAGMEVIHSVATEITGSSRYGAFKRSAYVKAKSGKETLLTPDSLGHHENYSTPLFQETIGGQHITAKLVSYLATRAVWAGAGIVTKKGFHLAQKERGQLYSIENNFSLTHGSKSSFYANSITIDPMVEIRSGDGNMSYWAIKTKLARTSLILRLLEHGEFPYEAVLQGKNAAQKAALQASANPNHPLPIKGQELTGVGHQLRIARAALDFANTHDVPAAELEAAYDVYQALSQIREIEHDPDALKAIEDRVDWAAKLAFIKRLLENSDSNVTSKSIRAVQGDLLWEEIGPRSYSQRHYASHHNLAPEDLLQKARIEPPSTRAARRVIDLQTYDPRDVSAVRWDAIVVVDPDETPPAPMTIPLYSPYDGIR